MTALPTLRTRVKVPFPAVVTGTGGIKVVKTNGIYTIAPAYDGLVAIPVTQEHLPLLFLSVFDSANNIYNSVSLSNLISAFVVGLDPTLTAIAGLSPVADRSIYFTGADAAAVYTLTPFARTLLDDADAATARLTLGLAREVLTANRTYYVRTDGSNSNNGLANTAGGAFLTIQYAVEWVRDNLDFGGHTVTIQVGAGTYTAGLMLANGIDFVGGICLLQGDTATPGNVLIAPTAAALAGIQVTYPTKLSIGGFKIAHASNLTHGMYISGGAVLRIVGKMDFGIVPNTQIVAASQGRVIVEADYNVTAGAVCHLYAYNDGFIEYGVGRAVTVSATPAFTIFALAARDGTIDASTVTYSGAATGQKYNVQSNAAIYKGGTAGVFPGDAAGATDGFGWYG